MLLDWPLFGRILIYPTCRVHIVSFLTGGRAMNLLVRDLAAGKGRVPEFTDSGPCEKAGTCLVRRNRGSNSRAAGRVCRVTARDGVPNTCRLKAAREQ